jgi:hypothetical protein
MTNNRISLLLMGKQCHATPLIMRISGGRRLSQV